MSEIVLDGIGKQFGSTVALDGVHLEVERGEFLVLLGPSGCGKSTLLRIIAGLEKPTEGRILVSGADVTDTEPGDRDLAFVFQSYALYPHMTVRRNLAFPLLMRDFRWWHHLPGLGRLIFRGVRNDPDIAGRVENAARTLGLTEMLDRHPRTLSGGQRQRVALGRALVRDPLAFLMDEPLSNLDAKLRNQMRHSLLELHARLGRTIVYVTHDQVEAMTMGTTIVVLDAGRVQQVASPSELYRRPANTYVAGFVGNPPMNLVPGGWLAGERGHVEVWGSTIAVAGGLDQPPGPVTVGIRPEDLEIVDAGEPDVIPGVVSLAEDLGGEIIVQVAAPRAEQASVMIGSGETLAVRHHGPAIAVGSPVGLRPKHGRPLTLFDPDSGIRIGDVAACPDATPPPTDRTTSP